MCIRDRVLTYHAKQPMIFSSGLFLFLFLGFSLIYMLLQNDYKVAVLSQGYKRKSKGFVLDGPDTSVKMIGCLLYTSRCV